MSAVRYSILQRFIQPVNNVCQFWNTSKIMFTSYGYYIPDRIRRKNGYRKENLETEILALRAIKKSIRNGKQPNRPW